MKKIGICAALFLIAAAAATAIDVSGRFATEVRAWFSDGTLAFNEEYGRLTFDQQVDDNLYCKVTLGARYFGYPAGSASAGSTLLVDDLGVLSALSPLEISLEEAYFTYSNFLFNGLDLSAGKERIPWGAADKLNPTDLLDPLDFSDPLDFGARTATVAVSLTYTLPVLDSSLQVVYEPYSPIARLSGEMLQGIRNALSAVTTSSWESETVDAPAYTLENYLFGARIAASIFGFDLSASYVSRLNDIPYVQEIDLSLDATYALKENDYTLGYYREHEIGFDAAKDLGFVLAWAEASVVFPQEAITTTRTDVLGTVIDETTTTAVTTDPYVKYTVGASQKIGAFYFNLQYNHGFFHERGNTGEARLQDYAVLRMELNLFSDKLSLGATGIGNVNTLADVFAASDGWIYLLDNYGVMGGLDLQYSPSVNLSITLGVMAFDGTGTTTIGAWRDNDLGYVKLTYAF